jgi:hypothetical protein
MFANGLCDVNDSGFSRADEAIEKLQLLHCRLSLVGPSATFGDVRLCTGLGSKAASAVMVSQLKFVRRS